jgi:hypothetical protein
MGVQNCMPPTFLRYANALLREIFRKTLPEIMA